MMPRPGIGYQDVAMAAQELIGQGKNVTIENVRKILGTGSIGTINMHLRRWKQLQESTQEIAFRENLPGDLNGLVKGLWERLVVQASNQFLPKEQEFQQEISQLKIELEKYRHNNHRWQNLFNQWQQEKAGLAKEKLTVDQALQFAHKENQSMRVRENGLMNQLQEKQERIDELHRMHRLAQDNLEYDRQAANEQRRVDQQQFAKQKQELLDEVRLHKQECVDQREQLMNIQEKNSVLLRDYHLLTERNERMIDEMTEMKNSLQDYQNRNDKLQQIIHDQKTENKMLSREVESAKSGLNNILDQLELHTQEKWELAKEKAKLEGQIKQMQKHLET